MDGMNHDILEQKMCKELKLLEDKYATAAGEMTVEDLKKIDMLYHALKSKATYDAMKEAGDYGYDSQMSGRRYGGWMSGHYEMPYEPDYRYPPRNRW